MRRTITMHCAEVYYLGKRVDYMYATIRLHFKLEDSDTHKYVITITESESGRYSFINGVDSLEYELWDGDRHVGGICKSRFRRIFFRPWVRKRYNITVKKVEIKRR